MKKVTQLTLASAIAVASAISAPAMADLSVNIGATSDYVWRGVSQTGNGAAVSGGVDYEDESGFYAGTWLSNTSLGTSETDLYLGYGLDLGNAGGLTVGYIYYLYPTIDNANFGEVHVDYSVAGFSVGVAVTVNDDTDEDAPFSAGDVFAYLGYGLDLGNDWSLGGTVGSYQFDDADVDYTYVQLDLGKSVGEFGDITLSVSVADSDEVIDVDDVLAGPDPFVDTDPLTFISWSKGF